MDICIILETPVIAMSESNGIGIGGFPGIGGMLTAQAHSALVPVTRQGPRYIEVNGKKRKIRKNGKISRWGPVPVKFKMAPFFRVRYKFCFLETKTMGRKERSISATRRVERSHEFQP